MKNQAKAEQHTCTVQIGVDSLALCPVQLNWYKAYNHFFRSLWISEIQVQEIPPPTQRTVLMGTL